MSLRVELHLDNIELPFRLVVLLTEAVDLVLFGVKLDAVPTLDVFLNFHPHDVSINRQSHLIGHGVDLSLLLLDSPSHIIKPFFHSQLKLFFRLNLL